MLTKWPFSTVPDEGITRRTTDRTSTKCSRMAIIPTSRSSPTPFTTRSPRERSPFATTGTDTIHRRKVRRDDSAITDTENSDGNRGLIRRTPLDREYKDPLGTANDKSISLYRPKAPAKKTVVIKVDKDMSRADLVDSLKDAFRSTKANSNGLSQSIPYLRGGSDGKAKRGNVFRTKSYPQRPAYFY
jgi:hypothetical protein